MTQDTVTSLIVDMMGITMKVAMPMLLAALIVGLAVVVIAGPWMLSSVVDWTHELWGGIPQTVDFKPVGGDER